MTSAAHHVREDEGNQHAKRCGRDAIEQLHCDDESRLAGYRKTSAADSECEKAHHKQRTPAPAFGSAAIGRRDGTTTNCGAKMHTERIRRRAAADRELAAEVARAAGKLRGIFENAQNAPYAKRLTDGSQK